LTPLLRSDAPHGAIKIEQLWRQLPAYGTQMTTMVAEFRQLYRSVRRASRTAPNAPTRADFLTRDKHHDIRTTTIYPAVSSARLVDAVDERQRQRRGVSRAAR